MLQGEHSAILSTRMLQGEHSAILSTFIKLPFVIKNFVLSVSDGRFTYVLRNFLQIVNAYRDTSIHECQWEYVG